MRGSGVDLPSGPGIRGPIGGGLAAGLVPNFKRDARVWFPVWAGPWRSGCADPTRVTRPRCFLGQNSKVKLPRMEPLGDMQPYKF